jgi:hypothetical protein
VTASRPASSTKTPREHAKARDLVKAVKQTVAISVGAPAGSAPPRPGTVDRYNWRHAAAASLHGWSQHEHHAGKPIQLSDADYEAALEAASAPKGVSYEPHKPALSPFKNLPT